MREAERANELRIARQALCRGSRRGEGRAISDHFGVNLLAAQCTRSTSNSCWIEAICIDTASPSNLPSMALAKGASLLMT